MQEKTEWKPTPYQTEVDRLFNVKTAKYTEAELQDEVLLNELFGEAIKEALAQEYYNGG